MKTSPFAGKPAEQSAPVNAPKFVDDAAMIMSTALAPVEHRFAVKALPEPRNMTVSEAVDAWRNEGDPN